MKVEVWHQGRSMGSLNIDSWNNFERYLLKWLSKPTHIVIKFEYLFEQIMWYTDVIDVLNNAQNAQENLGLKRWEATIIRIGQEVDHSLKN